jgi:3-ketoacyl-CoA synthase
MSTRDLVHHMRLSGLFTKPESVDFIEKVMRSAGFSPDQKLALSPGILKMKSSPDRKPGDPLPTPPTHEDALLESEEIIFSVVDDLLLKSGVRADEIDVVITTCSCFAPVPSLAAMVVNRFGMRADVLTASLVSGSC